MNAITGTHPRADRFSMFSEDELARLAEDIAENGLLDPVTVTTDGLILDGRNRAEACRRVGIEPATVVYEGDDPGGFVRSRNVNRRHSTTGQLAMSTALTLIDDGLRENGRWSRESGISEIRNSSTWREAVSQAGVILDYKPDLAVEVVEGNLTLNAAFTEAETIRTSAEREKIMARELAKREKQEATDLAEKNARIVTDLTQAGSKYVALIENGTFEPASAWAAHQEDTRKERRNQEELDHGIRSTVTRIAECVRYLDGGKEQADIFLKGFYPHEHRFLAEGMRLTPARVRSCIEFLTTIENGITK